MVELPLKVFLIPPIVATRPRACQITRSHTPGNRVIENDTRAGMTFGGVGDPLNEPNTLCAADLCDSSLLLSWMLSENDTGPGWTRPRVIRAAFTRSDAASDCCPSYWPPGPPALATETPMTTW